MSAGNDDGSGGAHGEPGMRLSKVRLLEAAPVADASFCKPRLAAALPAVPVRLLASSHHPLPLPRS
jgi:hypothetical protein